MFKRRKGQEDAKPDEVASSEDLAVETEQVVEVDVASDVPSESGPYDIKEAPEDEIARVDLGGLQIPIIDNMQLHLQKPSEDAEGFTSAVVVVEEAQSALELMAVAAPRSGNYWPEVMDELETLIAQSGGNMVRDEGRFGPELRGQVPANDEAGNVSLEPARFVGAAGNRWFIRGMLMGAAATDPGIGEFFEDIIASCVVNRGERPMAPGDVIALSPPVGVEAEEETETTEDSEGEYEDLKPFERGPEITETR